MRILKLSDMTLSVDFEHAHISSLTVLGKERIAKTTPLFKLRIRDEAGEPEIFTAYDATECSLTDDGAVYTGYPYGISVKVSLNASGGAAVWGVSVDTDSEHFVEWIDFPLISLPALEDNNTDGNGGKILFPYNEGALISDAVERETTFLRHREPEYPSSGCYAMFPNMLCSQMISYHWDDAGLYLGAHDPARALKSIDFITEDGSVMMLMRLFTGVSLGESFSTDYPIVWRAVGSRWESSAEVYRDWFTSSLPSNVKKIKDNPALPEWYADLPLVVSYPVRGVHDMDEMAPNALFPYMNAMPMLDGIKSATDARLLVLLMHWEGSAPWAPPYVWEPYGGAECFNEFRDTLHRAGDMLGVYCSGFGYTVQSNLVASYNMQEEYERDGLERGMCQGPDLKVHISDICTGQRSGYDVCPASEIGYDLLRRAYKPLFDSGVDYAQILDQNHGGGQYLCYARDHGHPYAPGKWMTENMQKMLGEWNELAPNMLFGCESAAAEPFIGNLLMSDNRYELIYSIGVPVPFYAYVYHEYLRNFMGNQVCCPFGAAEDSLCYRMAYSYAIGDLMTLVMTPSGDIMTNWGTREFDNPPSKDKVFTLVKNLTALYNSGAKKYLHNARMTAPAVLGCDSITYRYQNRDGGVTLPRIICTAWQTDDGSVAHLLVNPFEQPITCTLGADTVTVPALNGVIVEK